MELRHENILKVLDLHYSQFSKDFIGLIAKQQPTYKDRILEEDIYSVEDIRGDAPDIPDECSDQLTAIESLMTVWDCSYFRIIYT